MKSLSHLLLAFLLDLLNAESSPERDWRRQRSLEKFGAEEGEGPGAWSRDYA